MGGKKRQPLLATRKCIAVEADLAFWCIIIITHQLFYLFLKDFLVLLSFLHIYRSCWSRCIAASGSRIVCMAVVAKPWPPPWRGRKFQLDLSHGHLFLIRLQSLSDLLMPFCHVNSQDSHLRTRGYVGKGPDLLWPSLYPSRGHSASGHRGGMIEMILWRTTSSKECFRLKSFSF